MVRPKDTYSIRQRVKEQYVKNKSIKAKEICAQLDLKYFKHGKYVNRLLSTMRSNPNFESPLKAHSLHKRIFVWDDVPRVLLPEELQDGFDKWRGWTRSKNKNGMLVFRGKFGSVHWYKGGQVRVHMKGSVMLAQVKELFSRAFGWVDKEELCKFLDVPMQERRRHWVFKTKELLPPFEVRKFEKSHGIHIFSDKSHPNAVEVEETVPHWASKMLTRIDEIKSCLASRGKDCELQSDITLWRESCES